jgi:hypothetical protein
LIEEGLRRVLSDGGASKSRQRAMPPVSKADGGLQPGVNLNDSASLHEPDDRDYLARHKGFWQEPTI